MDSLKSQFDNFLKQKRNYLRSQTILFKSIRKSLIEYLEVHKKLYLGIEYYLYLDNGNICHSLGHKMTDDALFNLVNYNLNVRKALDLL
jgi:hypothetical protein